MSLTRSEHAPIELHLRVQIPAGTRDRFFTFLHEAIPFYESPGGIRVRLLEDKSDEHRFIEVIEYDSQESFDRDDLRVREDPEMKSMLERWRALLEQPPVVEVYKTRISSR